MTVPSAANWPRFYRRIRLVSSTRLERDAGPPSTDRPLDFIVEIQCDSLTYLSPHARAFTRLDAGEFDALAELSLLALDEGNVAAGVDTARARTVTSVELSSSLDEGLEPHRRARAHVNHHGCDEPARRPAWRRLLQYLGERLAGEITDTDRAHLAFLLEAFAAPGGVAAREPALPEGAGPQGRPGGRAAPPADVRPSLLRYCTRCGSSVDPYMPGPGSGGGAAADQGDTERGDPVYHCPACETSHVAMSLDDTGAACAVCGEIVAVSTRFCGYCGASR